MQKQSHSYYSFLKRWSFIVLCMLAISCQSAPEVKPEKSTSQPAIKQPVEVCEKPAPEIKTVIIEKPCDCQKDPTPASSSTTITNQDVTSGPIDLHANTDLSQLKRSHWHSIGSLNNINLKQSWNAWKISCQAMQKDPKWQPVCQAAQTLDKAHNGQPANYTIANYFTSYFNLYQSRNSNGSTTGLVTGYYQPTLKGSRKQSAQYPYPLYQEPSDLITVELSNQFPALNHKRVRGRVVGNKLVPYYTRAEIAVPNSPIKSSEFLYINDLIDVFFLQIQGSGVVELDTGETLPIGYANQNGHQYHSIGKILIRNGELKASQASMEGIKRWAYQHPHKIRTLLNKNPSFVFFRQLPSNLPGPLGALGVPLLAEQAIAVDKKYIPLGAPVFLSTTQPNSKQKLQKLVMAQDTGGAIKGGVRADFYWGTGNQAGAKAGAMKQTGRMWVLLPKSFNIYK